MIKHLPKIHIKLVSAKKEMAFKTSIPTKH